MTDIRTLLKSISDGDHKGKRAVFADRPGAFATLVARGALLELCTFGFYRFWLNTEIRRHLWAHTLIAGDGLEYTGRARELLIGFLMALAILAPVYFAYFLLGIEAERVKAFGSTPLVLVLLLFGQFAIYRARRYRLTRTTWRGVRFWMTGSGLDYMWRAFLWTLLVWGTLGFAYPWRAAALERYKMSRTFYGDLQGEFDGKASDFLGNGWWIWLSLGPLIVITQVALVFSVNSIVAMTKDWSKAGGIETGRLLLRGAPAILIPLLLILLIVSLYARFKTIEWRWWVSGLRLGPMSFVSNLKQPQYFGLLIKFALAMLPFAAIATGLIVYGFAHDPFFQKLLEASKAKQHDLAPQSLAQPSSAWLIMLAGYVLLLLAYNILQRIFFQHDFWRLIFSSLAIRGSEAADHVKQMGEASDSLGEGLADGLDVAGF